MLELTKGHVALMKEDGENVLAAKAEKRLGAADSVMIAENDKDEELYTYLARRFAAGQAARGIRPLAEQR